MCFPDTVKQRLSVMKRGTIRTPNIGIEFNLHDFEYDVYSLVKAFYPACEVKNFYTGEEQTGEFSLLLKVICEEHKITG